MSYKLEYRGINSYAVGNKINLFKVLPILFIIIFILSLVFGGKYFKFQLFQVGTLSKDDIQYYIDKTDEVSEGKVQVNWQQVAAISEVINEKKDDSITKAIANKFIVDLGNGEYKVQTIDKTISDLGLSSDNKNKVKKYLDKIEGLSIYGHISKEQQAFINFLVKPAYDNYKTYGIFPSVTIAQAILESGWGKSELSTDHNNLFGIKADSRWSGDVATMTTKENYDDTIEANFRKYSSKEDSIKDQGAFLYNNERYTVNGVFKAKDYKAQAQSLEDAGYSTAQNEAGEKIYADKLVTLIQKYNLMLYDTK